MPLISTIEQVQATGIRISNLDRGARLPDMQFAEQEYLLPVLGSQLLADLQANMSSETPDAALTALLPYVQKTLAAFAYWNDLPALQTRITDAGVRRSSTDNAPTAYRWEFDEARNYLEERAYAMQELMLAFLETNQDDYDQWTADEDAFGLRKLVLMHSGKQFNKEYRLYQPYRTYAALLPTMLDVEETYLEPLIGKAFVQSYRDAASVAALTDEEKDAFDLMKKAVANLTIYEASKKLPCQVTATGFVVKQVVATDAGAKDGSVAATDTVLYRASQAALVTGKKTLAALRKYLNATASATVMPDYFESEYYDAANTAVLDRKNIDRKIFRF